MCYICKKNKKKETKKKHLILNNIDTAFQRCQGDHNIVYAATHKDLEGKQML